jgi:hypothetical protein
MLQHPRALQVDTAVQAARQNEMTFEQSIRCFEFPYDFF